MIRKIVFLLTIVLPNMVLANPLLESFFKNLQGQWHGELSGVYKISIEASSFQTASPWALQTGTISIDEGTTTRYEFELSKNESQLDQEPVYFLKLKNLETSESQTYTLASQSDPRKPFSFWRHFVEVRDQIEYTTANAVKVFKIGDELTWGFASGSLFCKEHEKKSLCGTDSYMPYQLKKIGDEK